MAIDFCYLATIVHTEWELKREVFNFLTLNPESGQRYRVSRSFVVESIPSDSKCTDFPSDPQNMVCCDTVTLADNESFQIPSSNFTFALTVHPLSNLLAFNDGRTEFHIPHIRAILSDLTNLPPVGSIFQVAQSEGLTDGSPPLVRIHAGTYIWCINSSLHAAWLSDYKLQSLCKLIIVWKPASRTNSAEGIPNCGMCSNSWGPYDDAIDVSGLERVLKTGVQ